MFRRLYHYAALPNFYGFAEQLTPWLGGLTAVLMVVGLVGGLVLAPPDYQQGESYRIIFVHVPSAWMSLFVYVAMAAFAATGLVWRLKLAEVLAAASAPIGASFTFVALVTGSLWGRPMWGTYWVWDARLTSELILLFLYLGYMALYASISDKRAASRASAVLALAGVVNVPVIHFSVQWWATLHQGPTVSKLGAPAIHSSMLVPLLVMVVAFNVYYFMVLLIRARAEILEREHNATWVQTPGAV